MGKLGALRKARLRKAQFSGGFLGCFEFLSSTCSLGIQVRDPVSLVKSPILQIRLVNPLVFTMPLVRTLWFIRPKRALQMTIVNIQGHQNVRFLHKRLSISSMQITEQQRMCNIRERMGMGKFRRTFARTSRNNLRAPRIKMRGFEAKKARKFTRTLPRTLPWNFIAILSAPPRLVRRVESTPDPNTFEKYRDTPPISMAYFCKSMPSSWQKVVYSPPICIAIRLPFVSRYFCRSIRVRGRWDTAKRELHKRGAKRTFQVP